MNVQPASHKVLVKYAFPTSLYALLYSLSTSPVTLYRTDAPQACPPTADAQVKGVIRKAWMFLPPERKTGMIV